MRSTAIFVPLLALLLAIAAPAAAEERILDYGSDIVINADGSLDVTETIQVKVEGIQIRRGLYRDFPTRYVDRLGNRVVVGFELLGVERDGRPEPYFTENLSNGVRINTGNDDLLPMPTEHTFRIRYRTTRQLGYFDANDELYFNTTGLGWAFPIEKAWARVHLPADVPRGELQVEAYTGGYGTQGRAYEAEIVGPREIHFETTRPLGISEGLTIVVGFPKGLVARPTNVDRARWFLRDNGGVLVGLVGLLLLLAFYGLRWQAVGRDPQAGPVFPRYEVPTGLSPGEVRMLSRMGYDNRAFAADVVDMAVRGYLDIHANSSGWRLVRQSGASTGALMPSQVAIATRLFAGGGEIELKDTNAAFVGGARTAQNAAMSRRLTPKYFAANGGSLLTGILFSVVVAVASFVIAGGSGIPVLFVLGFLGFGAHILFAFLLKAPTREGRRLMDEIEGLKMYLSVAERDEIAAMKVPGRDDDAGGAPHLDAKRYEALLPYAMALDVESAWTKKFTAAVGVREAESGTPSWYHGSRMSDVGIASLGNSLGSALTSQISSAATPPGSSSGSSGGGGGGGFSGGGGGGGGGGGR